MVSEYTTFTNLSTTSFKVTDISLGGNTAEPVVVDVTSVDCSTNGVAQEAALVTVPADSILLDVTAVVTTTFNGDTTQTFEVGITGNTDKYVDPSDLDVTGSNQQSMIGGTNNDQKNPEYIAADTALIATWTNTTSADQGAATVRVTYIPLA